MEPKAPTEYFTYNVRYLGTFVEIAQTIIASVQAAGRIYLYNHGYNSECSRGFAQAGLRKTAIIIQPPPRPPFSLYRPQIDSFSDLNGDTAAAGQVGSVSFFNKIETKHRAKG